MTIDPLSIATDGFITNDNVFVPIAFASLGYIKISEEITPIFTISRSGGGGSTLYNYKKPKPILDKKHYLDIVICASLTSVNDKNINNSKEEKVRYKDEYNTIKVIVSKITKADINYEVFVTNVENVTENLNIKIKDIKLLPIKTLLSGSVKTIKMTMSGSVKLKSN